MRVENKVIINVPIKDNTYPIVIGSGLLRDSELLQQYLPNKQLAIVSNEIVAPIYLQPLLSQLSQRELLKVILADGEANKTLETLTKVFDALLAKKFDRKALLCSLGGGVVGDITGFAAACYRRGIDFVQIPTTLLAQVDAAIGGKTAVNHPLGKNMIGAFYQPKAVLIDVETLQTLPEREFKAGLAEVLKYAFIKDVDFLDFLIQQRKAILNKDAETLIAVIKRCCEIKAEIVAADEREQGERALLNFGHSFGHALETATQYSKWLHGEAVAIGMAAASYMSWQLGYLKEQNYRDIVDTLKSFELPITQHQNSNAKELKACLLQDKKILEGQLRLILLKSVGDAQIVSDFPEDILNKTLEVM